MLLYVSTAYLGTHVDLTDTGIVQIKIQFAILPDWLLWWQSQKVKFSETNLGGVKTSQNPHLKTASLLLFTTPEKSVTCESFNTV